MRADFFIIVKLKSAAVLDVAAGTNLHLLEKVTVNY